MANEYKIFRDKLLEDVNRDIFFLMFNIEFEKGDNKDILELDEESVENDIKLKSIMSGLKDPEKHNKEILELRNKLNNKKFFNERLINFNLKLEELKRKKEFLLKWVI
jgi:hypothetical protein